MPKMGAFAASAMASAVCFVFPVLEKYNTHGFMASKCNILI
jgi:hypothetical protein